MTSYQIHKLRENLRNAKQIARDGKWLETRLRAEGRVAAYRVALKLALRESKESARKGTS